MALVSPWMDVPMAVVSPWPWCPHGWMSPGRGVTRLPTPPPPQSLSLREQLSRRRSGLEEAPSDGDGPVRGVRGRGGVTGSEVRGHLLAEGVLGGGGALGSEVGGHRSGVRVVRGTADQGVRGRGVRGHTSHGLWVVLWGVG